MKTVRLLSFLLGMTLSIVAVADDTDVYLKPGNTLPPGSEPMVMFTLDYRPNLYSTFNCGSGICDNLINEGYLPMQGSYIFFDILRAALRKVMDPLEGIRVGLMLNHESQNNCEGPLQKGCSNGSYVAMGFELFDKGDTNGAKAKFDAILGSLPAPQGPGSHMYQGKELFFELYRYLTGQGIYNGHNGWADYDTDTTMNLDGDSVANAWKHSWDTTVENGSNYISPLAPAGQCTKIFTVNPMFQVSNQDDNSDTAIADGLRNGGLGGEMKTFTDIVRYMNDADLGSGKYPNLPDIDGNQNITSYFLIRPTQINKTTIGYAAAGGTGVPLPLSDNPDDLVNTLEDIFRQILSVSTTFVAASVPVNVFNRAEVVDNVYIALFQVDEKLKPAWDGNVKKLRLGEIDGATLLVDANNNPAVAGDGRIRNDALTYWTLPALLPPPNLADGEVALKDGRVVDRGGAGQKIPGFLSGSPGLVNGLTNRRVFFDGAGGIQALKADLLTATALQADLGAADTTEAAADIAFLRGLDVDDIDGDGDITEPRDWLFNDPLHSRPLPINYGARGGYSASNPAIYIAVASNDGLLHFIRNTTVGSAEAGVEAWAFAPRSTMGAVSTLRANGSGVPHPYTIDGSPVAYVEDANNNGTIEVGERAYLYFGLRRGGKAYYALDVSDPDNPKMLWSIDKSGDFAELGYTFSTPRLGQVNLGSGPQPVLVFAGGYDMNKDIRGAVGTDDSEGNAIYVVDAETGALIWKAVGGAGTPSATVFPHADLVDSIPSTVTVADTDGDLLLDRIVVGDTGGNIWRADIPGSNTSDWKLTKVAALGRHAVVSPTKADDRRFFHRVDLVQSEDATGLFDAIAIGSGDRADPLDLGGTVENWFYMIKDRNIAPGSGVDSTLVHGDLGDVTNTCVAKNASCTADLTYGWRLELEESREKSLATPITIAGRVFFTTYVPTYGANACGPSEGLGKAYAVSLQNAGSVINYDTTDDDPNYPDRATSKDDRSTYLNSPGIPAEVVALPPNQILRPDLIVEDIDVTTRWRTYWHLEENSDL